MSAARLLAEAIAAGVSMRLQPDGRVRLAADREPPAPLLAELREHRHEVVALLRGERLDWTQPGAVSVADGRAAHVDCYELAELPLVERFAKNDGDALEPTGLVLDEAGDPVKPCGRCGGRSFHQAPSERWRCWACEPLPLPSDGTALVGWSFCALPPDPADPMQDGSPKTRGGAQERDPVPAGVHHSPTPAAACPGEPAPAWDVDRGSIALWRTTGPALADRLPVLEAQHGIVVRVAS